MLNPNPVWPSKNSVHFLHNWRCAGTTINSILSSNYHDRYLKIGHPFTSFGWPYDYNNHPDPLLTLGQIRSSINSLNSETSIIGGHTFLGLESFLPGSYDIWMNYRDPLKRLNSGILRFYNKQYSSKSSHSNLIDVHDSLESTDLDFSDFVDNLLSTNLRRESNGISRRLASLSLSSELSIGYSTNVETVDFLLDDYSDNDLYESALANLGAVKLLINFSYIQASILSIEHIYDLSSPLINPFSNLAHNPITLSGVKANDSSVINLCKDVLLDHSRADIRLLPHLNTFFANQINSAHISQKDIAVRDAIHNERLLLPKWFVLDRFNPQDIIQLVSEALEVRCREFVPLADDILGIFFRWEGFTLSFRQDINRYMVDNYSRKTYF